MTLNDFKESEMAQLLGYRWIRREDGVLFIVSINPDSELYYENFEKKIGRVDDL